MLARKSIELLFILKKENDLKQISQKMNLSDRAVRYEVENLNFYLKKFNIGEIIQTGKKLKLVITSKEKLLTKLSKENYNFSKDEREDFILANYLFNGESRQKVFEEELNVSAATIANDIQRIKEKVNSNGLEFKGYTKTKSFIVGEEKKVRQMMLNFLIDYLFVEEKYYVDVLIKEVITKYFEGIDVKDIRSYLNEIQIKIEKTISDEAHKILTIYLMILVRRVKQKFVLDNFRNEQMVKKSKEYQTIIEILPELEEKYKIKINQEEKYLFTEYVLGSHSYNFSYSYYENWFQLEILVNKLIIGVNSLIDIDILGDKILLEGLLNHLKPAIYRIKQGIKLENSIFEEVYESYPQLFKVVESEIGKYKSYLEVDVNKDEIAFLTIHFKEAMDRREIKQLKNILIVCGFGYGSSKLLKENVKKNFDVNVIDAMPLHKFYEMDDFNNIDLIITTVPIKTKGIDTIKVNPILLEEDIKKLEERGLRKERKSIDIEELVDLIKKFTIVEDEELLKSEILKKYPEKFTELRSKNELMDLLQKENIYVDVKFDNWLDCIKFFGKEMMTKGYVEKDYVDSMIEVLSTYGSYMLINDNILLAHGKTNEDIHKTGLLLGVLNKEVEYLNDKKIKFIVMFSSKDGNEHLNALLKLTELMEDKKLFDKLDGVKSSSEAYDIINKLM